MDGKTLLDRLIQEIPFNKVFDAIDHSPQLNQIMKGLDEITLGDLYKSAFPKGLLHIIKKHIIKLIGLKIRHNPIRMESNDEITSATNDDTIFVEGVMNNVYDPINSDADDELETNTSNLKDVVPSAESTISETVQEKPITDENQVDDQLKLTKVTSIPVSPAETTTSLSTIISTISTEKPDRHLTITTQATTSPTPTKKKPLTSVSLTDSGEIQVDFNEIGNKFKDWLQNLLSR